MRLTAKFLLVTGVLLFLIGIASNVIFENHLRSIGFLLIGFFYIVFSIINRKSRHRFWDKFLDWSGIVILIAGIAFLLIQFFTNVETVK